MKKVLLPASLLGAVLFSAQVGINTEDPEATFDVNGNVRVQSTATTVIPSNSDCPCFLVVDKKGELKRIPMSQGTGSGIGGGSSSGGSTTGGGVSSSEGGVANTYVLTPDTVVEMDWGKYKSNQSTVQLSVNLPEGIPYSAYMSPAVELPMLDGTMRKVSITYPKGVTDSSKKITAVLLYDGDQTFAPKLRFTPSEEQNYEIPLAFNGLEQTAKLVLHAGISAVKNTEHSKGFLYPVKKVGNHYITLINLGAKYAEEAATNPSVLKTWISNPNWATDKKSYGSLFQWQRPADGHELIDWSQSSPVVSQTTSALSNNANWTAGHDKFITNNNSQYSWVTNTVNQNNNKTLWQSGGANNPCPSGYHVPKKSEWEALVTASGASFSSPYNADLLYDNLRLPASGYRYSNDATLSHQGSYRHFWSSEQYSSGSYNSWSLYGSSSSLGYSDYRAYGLSVRCLKD